MKTRITELLGIQYPIMQGGMQHLGAPVMAAAVSNAGGIGTINAATFPDYDDFRNAIRETKALTDKPFCINFSLIPDVEQSTYFRQLEIMVEEGARIVETAGANPSAFVPFFKDHNFIWIHKAPTVKHALKGQALGADAVTVVGYEVGGHPGKDELGANVLVRHAARELEVPVLAAGGYSDGAGVAAALAMGAEGVTMGTRFIATRECPCHDNFKQWILKANEADTLTVQRSIHNMMRAANNEAARKCLELEAKGATLQELMTVISGKLGKECYGTGNTDGSIFPVGQGIGLIDDIPTVDELMKTLMADCEATIRRLNGLL